MLTNKCIIGSTTDLFIYFYQVGFYFRLAVEDEPDDEDIKEDTKKGIPDAPKLEDFLDSSHEETMEDKDEDEDKDQNNKTNPTTQTDKSSSTSTENETRGEKRNSDQEREQDTDCTGGEGTMV